METPKKSNITFILIVTAFCLYAGVFIYRTSFVIDGERYFSLFDDFMIGMRYAKNLADGYGLVWNPGGERVDGCTNLLWVIYMSFFHLFPVPISKISLFIQVSGALLLAVNLFFVKKIADFLSNDSTAVSLGAAVLIAFYLPVNGWSLLGSEVSILILIVNIALWQTLQCITNKKFSLWPYILLGMGTFIRTDMVVPFFAILSFIIITDAENRQKNLVWGTAILVFCMLGQTAFRMYYYGDILPNTYYLKMTGFPVLLRITRGLFVFLTFIWKMNLLLFLLPFSILFYRRDKPVILLLWVFLTQVAYSIYVGGDAWEDWGGSNRYISVVMPGFFILFSYALYSLCHSIMSNSSLSERAGKISIKYAFLFLLVVSFVHFNSIHGLKALKELFLIKQPMEMEVKDHKDMVEFALLLRKITTPQAKIAYDWGGTAPYFAGRYAIDSLGKSEKRIARKQINTNTPEYQGLKKYIAFIPGHNKYDFKYMIEELRPDVLMLFGQFWFKEEAIPYVSSKNYQKVILQDELIVGGRPGYRFSFRKDSAHILWDEIERFK